MDYRIGLNVGYGWTKAVNGEQSAVFESCIAPALQVAYKSDLANVNGHHQMTVNGQQWFVGETARLHQPDLVIEPRARGRAENVILPLALSALYRVGVRDGQVSLITGLPIRWYAQDKNNLAEMLNGKHVFTAHSLQGANVHHTVEIANVVVVPEAFGTYFRVLLNSVGELTDPAEIRNEHVAVADIGTHNTNYLAIAPGPRYTEGRSGSTPVGMARVYEIVVEGVYQKYGRELSFRAAEDVVRNSTAGGAQIRIDGELRNIDEIVTHALGAVAEAVTGTAKTLWGDGNDFAVILLTGGGAHPLRTYFEQVYKHARIITDDPQLANATGFYRYALRKFAVV